jgi:putative hydrolase
MVQNSLRHLGQAQREKAVNANTKATIEALYQNPQVDILAHPGLFFRVDIEEVARACIKNEVMFEINCGHSHPDISDIIKAYEAGVDFIVNSDAHFRETVGNLDYGRHVIESLGIEPERVVNCQPEGGGRDGSRQTYGFACFNNYRPVRSRENPGDKLP